MGLSYTRFLCALTSFILLHLRQLSVLASPIEVHNPSTLISPIGDLYWGNGETSNESGVGQAIINLLRQLEMRSDVRFRTAELAGVFLRVSPGEQPSNNIADFRSIGCLFLYGGDAPPMGKFNGFAVVNQWPEHWGEWNHQVAPRLVPTALEEIPWQKTQTRMSVQKADYLLKAAGYVQRYRGVVMLKLANRPLGYCFSQVDDLRNLNVDIWTGRVSEVRECSVSL
ncbi:MAG: hypothetical protein Q9169_000267 [Polycauliona sp. 2 TL-2023]